MEKEVDLVSFFHDLKRRSAGILSVCTVNEFVLDSVMRFYKERGVKGPIVIESTANQVNQYGGYSGLTPAKFRNLAFRLARKHGIETQRIILGADHAGPWPWRNLPADKAMDEAKSLVVSYVKAGYKKIHIDVSQKLPGDKNDDPITLARRQAELCFIAEETYKKSLDRNGIPPVYVLGTDVPAPGGSAANEPTRILSIDDLIRDLETTEHEFTRLGLTDAWSRVVAYVIHSGADFSSFEVTPYDRNKLKHLISFLATTRYVLEAHSTDYQTPESLAEMVQDGFAILKVGPELTFRFREAVFALCQIENEITQPKRRSHLINTVLSEMRNKPEYWLSYYQNKAEIEMKYSLLDRIRYYWQTDNVKRSMKKLLTNLWEINIPASLIHQYFPDVSDNVAGIMKLRPLDLIYLKIERSLEKYYHACKMDIQT